MIRVDTREGSKDYIEPLIASGLPVQSAILPAGDVEIVGKGPGGRPYLVGVEIKKWDDVMACVRSGRFADQLRGMKAAFECNWLLIEGRIRITSSEHVAIERGTRWYTPPGKMKYAELSSWLLNVCSRGGVLLWRTESQQESVAWLRALYWSWVSKEYEQHRSLADFYQPPLDSTFREPSLAQKWAVNVPGIGRELAGRAAEKFGSAYNLAHAGEKEWQGVQGVGGKRAKSVVEAIRSDSSQATPPMSGASGKTSSTG